MAIMLPFPLRVAAGIVGTTLDRLTRLPSELPGLGVSLAGQALRTSMRIRQEVADLAIRGDELLGDLTGGRNEPGLATFDEDQPESSPAQPAPASTPDAPDRRSPGAKPAAARPTATPEHPEPGVKSVNGQVHTIAELRAAIRDLPAGKVRELLEVERAGQARAPWITLLENRLTTLEHSGQ